MKERVNLILTDLDNSELTLKQLLLVFEKILTYYSEKDINNFIYIIEEFNVYFYMLYQLVQEVKGE